MPFTSVPTEQTTAATDLLLALAAFVGAFVLLRTRGPAWPRGLWVTTLAMLEGGALLGAVLHGLTLPTDVGDALWMVLYLALGLVVGFVLLVALAAVAGPAVRRPGLVVAGLVAAALALLTRAGPGSFLLFIAYEAVAVFTALCLFSWLALRGRLASGPLLPLGLLLTVLAAGVQAMRLGSFTLIWEFDHNSAYHLIQLVALVPLVVGVRRDLRAAGR